LIWRNETPIKVETRRSSGINNVRLMMWNGTTSIHNAQMSAFTLRIKLPALKLQEPIGQQLESCFNAALMNKQDGTSQKAAMLIFNFMPGLDVKSPTPAIIEIDLGNAATLSSMYEISCGR